MNTISYREATAADASRLVEVQLAHIIENREYISGETIRTGVALDGSTLSSFATDKWSEYLLDVLADRDYFLPVVLSDDKVIGFAVAAISRDGDVPFGTIRELILEDTFRGQGIGKALLEKAEKWLRERGASNCFLEAGRHNHFSHEFLSRQGYSLTSLTFHKIINAQSEFDFSDQIKD